MYDLKQCKHSMCKCKFISKCYFFDQNISKKYCISSFYVSTSFLIEVLFSGACGVTDTQKQVDDAWIPQIIKAGLSSLPDSFTNYLSM